MRLAIPTKNNWYCKQYAVDFARAIEAKVHEMLKVQGPATYLCTNVQSGDLDATVLDPQDVFEWNEQELWHLEPLYRLPEGD